VAAANAPDERDPLDTVLLGVCTGSVACAAALRIQLRVFERERSKGPVPAMVVLNGSYHGTDMVAQSLHGIPAARSVPQPVRSPQVKPADATLTARCWELLRCLPVYNCGRRGKG
jgi:adenosylmethionine-8-amino-7-oxononanoate aminotransferase